MSVRQDYIQSIKKRGMRDIALLETRWQSPSNIALIKYWGKHGVQLPMNPSISFTLSRCFSDTHVMFRKKDGPSSIVDLSFFLDGEHKPHFESRIKQYLESIIDMAPFLTAFTVEIQTSNSFPHSAGIASSASGFSALALSLATLEDALYETLNADEDFRQKASFLARLGSGSACRSIYKQAAWWGTSNLLENASDEFAVPCDEVLHPIFDNFQDSILIVSAAEKPVSSSKGHHLMEFHPYREGRLTQVQKNLSELIHALRAGDLEHFGKIVENEALSLHALMLSSNPGYFLITQNTIDSIRAIREFRVSEGVPCYFTLDAGPNIHLLYPKQYVSQVKEFLESELESMTERIIYDEMGSGPVQLV